MRVSTTPPALIGANRARFLSPPSSQPDFTWGKAVPLGLLLTYRQTWTPKGYSRGALLNSFSLAPGEELTLEVFNWDRARLEQERSVENSRDSTLTASVRGTHFFPFRRCRRAGIMTKRIELGKPSRARRIADG
jgi:hypothetical protein